MITLTEQDFYDMRNQRDEERKDGIAKDIRIAELEQALNALLRAYKYDAETRDDIYDRLCENTARLLKG